MKRLMIAVLLMTMLSVPIEVNAQGPENERPSFGGRPNYTFEYHYQPFDSDGFDSDIHAFEMELRIFEAKGMKWTADVKSERLSVSEFETVQSYFPEDLDSLSLFVRGQSRRLMLMAGIKSSSDKIFDTMDEFFFGGGGMYNVIPTRRGGLFLGAFYYTSLTDYPFPLIQYTQAGPDLMLSIGAPTFVRWRFSQRFSLQFNYFPVLTSHLAFNYHPTRRLTVGIEGDWRQRSYHLAERDDEDETLYLETGRMGVKLSKRFVMIEAFAFAGYQFGSRYYIGESVTDRNAIIDLDDEWVGAAGIRAGF